MTGEKLLSQLKMADQALNLIESGQVPQVRNYLRSARCEFNTITDVERFWGYDKETTDEDFERQQQASEKAALIRSVPDSLSHFVVYTEPNTTKEQLALFRDNMQSFMAVMFAAVGLDMTALGKQTWESKDDQ